MQSTKPFRCKAIREVRAALPQRYPPTSLYDSEISRGVPSKAFSTNRSKARRWFHVSLTIPASVYLGEEGENIPIRTDIFQRLDNIGDLINRGWRGRERK